MRRLLVAALVVLAACGPSEQTEAPSPDSAAVWTLYRSAVMLPGMEGDSARVHVATFDSRERAGLPGPSFNAGNCADVADLLERQPGVTVRYWCERGREQGLQPSDPKEAEERTPEAKGRA